MATRLITRGLEIAFRLEGPAHAPVVVFANGLGMDMSMWSPQVAAFTRRYQTLRYDLRGHGGTPAIGGEYSLRLLAADVLALMDGLNIRSAHFVGTSLGAMIGQQFALTYPERLLSLSLCATTSAPPRDAWQTRIVALRENGLATHVERIVERWFLPEFGTSRRDIVDRMHEMVLATDLDGYIGCAAAIRDMNLSDALAQIICPTLVVAGDEDQVTPLPDLELIADRIPHARFVRISGSAHMPTIEQPEACNAAILTFLGLVDAQAGTAAPSRPAPGGANSTTRPEILQ